MSSMVDSLNLRPQEKRVIVVIAVAVFVILNLVLVFPHFKDYGNIQKELLNYRTTNANYSAAIAEDNDPVNGSKRKLEKLEKSKGGAAGEFKEIALEETVTSEARANGLFIQSQNTVAPQRIGPTTQSDKFFESQSTRIVVQATEDSLVKFLYDMGNDPAMIRVWELSLSPMDQNRYKLNASITLTADYQKTNASGATPAKTRSLIPMPLAQGPGPRPAATNVNPAPPGRGPLPAPPGPGRAAPPPAMPSMPSMPPMPGRRSPRTNLNG